MPEDWQRNLNVVNQYLPLFQIEHLIESNEQILLKNKVSDGQRRRLAFFNLCLENRPICLFDEPSSDQDPEFKLVFYKKFLSQLKKQGKCVLVITHDDRFFNLADRVIYLNKGRIVS